MNWPIQPFVCSEWRAVRGGQETVFLSISCDHQHHTTGHQGSTSFTLNLSSQSSESGGNVWLAFVTENQWNFHDSIILIVEISLAHACKDISIKVSPVQFEQMVLREDDYSRGFLEFYSMYDVWIWTFYSVSILINVLVINLDDDDQSGRDHNHNSNTFLNFLPGLSEVWSKLSSSWQMSLMKRPDSQL